MKTAEVVHEITRRSWLFGVSVLMSPAAQLKHSDGSHCSGFFDENIPTLQVATAVAETDWLGILIHEYGHVTQWVEQCPPWVAHAKTPGMWDWLEGKPLRGAKHVVALTRDLEADCERRTARLIQELGAPMDLGAYCQQANAYIHFHNVIAEKRKWVKKVGILRDPVVYQHFNKTIDSDFTKTPKALFDLLVKHAI